MKQIHGTVDYPLHQRMRDTAVVHGWNWTLAYFKARMHIEEFRVIARVAYLYR